MERQAVDFAKLTNGEGIKLEPIEENSSILKREAWFGKSSDSFLNVSYDLEILFPHRIALDKDEPTETESSEDQLKAIYQEVERSRCLLDLAPDWDDEGSSGYLEQTWERATRFLTKHASWFWTRYSIVVEAPEILPGPDGSIDIYWKNDGAELLLNVPAELERPLSCYGDAQSGIQIRGPLLDSEYKRGLWVWLNEDLHRG